VVYRIDPDGIVVLEVFSKKSQQTPQHVIQTCRDRLKNYEQISRG
jgi:phage-related protein